MDCENIDRCNFFEIDWKTNERKTAFQGFVRMYCRGGLKDKCVRRKVGRALGGPSSIPENMMPNGMPIVGTDDSKWSPEVKALAKSRP